MSHGTDTSLSRRRALVTMGTVLGLSAAASVLAACGASTATSATSATAATSSAASAISASTAAATTTTPATTAASGQSASTGTTSSSSGAAQAASSAPGKTVKLTNVEDDSRPLDNQAYANVYKAFRDQHPNIEIDFQILPWEQAEAKERTQAQAGTLPDMGRSAYAADLVKLNAMVPLDQYATPAYLARYPKDWLPSLYLQGPDNQNHLYSIAWFAGDKAICVNQNFLEKAGLKVTSDWSTDQFDQYAKALTIPNQQWGVTLDAAGVGDPWQNFWLGIRAFGGGLVKGKAVDSTAPAPITINTPEFIKGATWYRDLFKNGWAVKSAPTDTYQQRDANFMSGKAAMMWQGPWSLIDQRNALKQHGWDMAAMPLPKGPAGNPQSGGIAGTAGIFSTAKQRGVVDEAWTWISFLCSDAGQKIYSSTNGMLPASQALWKLPQFANDPIYGAYLSGFQTYDLDYPLWAVGVSTVFDQKGVPMMQGLLLNQLTPEQMAQQLQTEVVNFLRANGVQVPTS
jgi:ABC-type glycerol-3-phosphate transport system substrate-binding protein